MAARHVDSLFSEAYDGLLGGGERQRFDDHLAACPQCAEEFAAFSAAVDALRSLPQARMPVPVRLPAAAPGVERRRQWWSWRLPRLGPAGALGGALAIGAAAALVVVSLHSRQGGAPGAGATAAQAGIAGGQAHSQSGGSDLHAPAAAAACSPQAVAADAAAPPEGYANQVRQTVPGRPGEILLLATPAGTYTAGATVIVYARLIPAAPSAASAVLPCVQLVSGARYAQGAAAPTGGAAPVPNNSADLSAVAAPTAGPNGTTLLTITLPSSLSPGESVQLVAYLPAGFPDAGDTAPISATLSLTIAPPSTPTPNP